MSVMMSPTPVELEFCGKINIKTHISESISPELEQRAYRGCEVCSKFSDNYHVKLLGDKAMFCVHLEEDVSVKSTMFLLSEANPPLRFARRTRTQSLAPLVEQSGKVLSLCTLLSPLVPLSENNIFKAFVNLCFEDKFNKAFDYICYFDPWNYYLFPGGFQRKASHQRSSSRVSSKRMTPERKRRAFGDVKRSSRRDWRLDSMFSTLMLARRLPMVPVLSSAAKIPFPGVAMYLAFWISSSGEYQNKAFGYRDI
ncbi:hypothetical protein LWI28_008776 [Acer negundo]|uniref:Uncharacterized protein n=1 Tax=Acer negundo TaxID=4023 RepID=A0AAD5J504_ACENE|nr:hypothetical protein LWI28_008776 [Acer negundo]